MNQEKTIDLPILNFPAQKIIFEDPAQFKIVVKGRRFGLTKGGANDYIQQALSRKFKKGLWVDTINGNIDKYVMRYFIPALKMLPEQIPWQWKRQERVLYILDSYIDFRSVDNPQNIEGFAYDKFFLNEAGIILKDEYLWYNSIRPMLEEYKPKGVIGGTPKGRGLFERLAYQAKSDEFPNYSYYHRTSYDNPYLTKDMVDSIAMDMPEIVRKQEIYAEFLDDGGEVFRKISEVMDATPLPPKVGHSYVMGVDLAKVQDWTVISVYDRSNNRQVFQDRFQTLEWPFQKKRIMEVARHYNGALIIIDATGVGDPVADDLIRAGLAVEPVKLTNEIKKEIIEKLSIWIELKKIAMINIKETMTELENFSYEITNHGRIIYNAREGQHDDIVIANALAVWKLTDMYIEPEVSEEPLLRQEYRTRIKEMRNLAPQAEVYDEQEYETV